MPERNFPPPWSVEELDSCFVVKDANGQPLAYMYFEKEPRRPFRRELLTRDEARNASLPFSPSCRSCWASPKCKGPSFSSGFHLYATAYAWVSSPSNIAEANKNLAQVRSCSTPSHFWTFPVQGRIVSWL
jgi:hypothetical protein